MNHDDLRPNPDQLLSALKRDGEQHKRGRLKIFFGMAAGVGKTYAMLRAAHELKRQQVDVVVGWVDTHGRKDTADLVQGLEVVPRQAREHRGVTIPEMDLDAILTRKPQTVLVDELAHTNAPGSRHLKRYLDVLEILRSGIDVYTTLNVQHLESRVNTVREITGVPVQETIPDSILDQASEIILIDIAPDDLLKRLRDGSIYPRERIETASRNFFRRENLTALREMSLRLAAETVDRELRSFKVLHGIEGTWKSGSRFMVAIYASPYSEALIRWTRRLADLTGSTWLGVYVEGERALSPQEQELLTKNRTLVTQLGGELVSTNDADAATGILRCARQNNVTQLIIGKPRRGFWSDIWRGGSLVSRLIKQSGGIDIYVVTSDRQAAGVHRDLPRRARRKISWDDAGWVLAIALATWLVAGFLEQYIGYLAVGIVFLIAVSLAGLFLTRASVLCLALLFGVIHNFFFIPPIHTFSIQKPEDILTLSMYFIAAATLGHLTSRLKRKELILRDREQRALLLYGLTKDLAAMKSIDEIAGVCIAQLGEAFGADICLALLEEAPPHPVTLHPGSTFMPSDKEWGVVEWTKTHKQMAGRFTDTLPGASGIYFPITGRDGVLGVVGIRVENKSGFSSDEVTLAETCLRQIAAGLDRELYHRQSRRYEVIEETQKLYKTLLDSVSHELKTPLATIKGSASALQDPLTVDNKLAVSTLAAEIMTSTARLQRLVDNLLDMTRIDSGMLQPKRELSDAEDLIGAALHRLDAYRATRNIDISIAEHLPPIICDQVLLVQALINIIHNAFVYAPSDSGIEITAQAGSSETVEIAIRDHGPGLPAANPERVLGKFYRENPGKSGGIGLGLSIAQGFIELQHGSLRAGNHPQGGAVFTVVMPAGRVDEREDDSTGN